MSIEFMHRMVATYHRVHSDKYWHEITSVFGELPTTDFTVADLGCGPGLLLVDLVKNFGPKRLLGVDLSPIMLDRAKEELDAAQNEGSHTFEYELIQQHLQEDPSLPSGVDIFFSSRVLRSFEDQEVIMRSIYSSLNTGGYLVVLDWTRASIPTYAQWFDSLEGEFNDLTPNQIIAYHRIFSRYSLDDWNFILSSFGFHIVHQFQLDPVHSVIIGKK